MRKYTQLTRGKRYQIRTLLKAGFSQFEMVFFNDIKNKRPVALVV